MGLGRSSSSSPRREFRALQLLRPSLRLTRRRPSSPAGAVPLVFRAAMENQSQPMAGAWTPRLRRTLLLSSWLTSAAKRPSGGNRAASPTGDAALAVEGDAEAPSTAAQV